MLHGEKREKNEMVNKIKPHSPGFAFRAVRMMSCVLVLAVSGELHTQPWLQLLESAPLATLSRSWLLQLPELDSTVKQGSQAFFGHCFSITSNRSLQYIPFNATKYELRNKKQQVWCIPQIKLSKVKGK